MIKSVIAHLHFDGRAGEAIAFYQGALGAQVEARMHWSEMPGGQIAAEDASLVMHARLAVGQGVLLLADVPKDAPHRDRHNGTLMLEFDDAADLLHCFDALSQGGTVQMPVHDAFWGAKFALVDDRFGVSWMLHCAKNTSC